MLVRLAKQLFEETMERKVESVDKVCGITTSLVTFCSLEKCDRTRYYSEVVFLACPKCKKKMSELVQFPFVRKMVC